MRKGYPKSEERNRSIVKLVKEGKLSYSAIGRQYHISKQRIEQIKRAYSGVKSYPQATAKTGK